VFRMNDDILLKIRKWPHLLGHAIGKTRLKELHSEWIRYMWESYTSVALQAPRGTYKTTALDIVGPIWWLLFHPNDRIAIIRKTATDACDIIKTISAVMKLSEVQCIFQYAHGMIPYAQIDRDNKLVFNFKGTVTPEGNIDGYGIDGNYTGKHYEKILVDDVITRKDRWSRAERERVKNGIRELQTNVLEPGQPLMATGTPWHKKDAWEVLPEPRKYYHEDCQILSPEELELKKKLTTPALYAINHLLKHIASEDALFKDPVMGKWDWRTNPSAPVSHLDAAFDGSHTNAFTILQDRLDGKIQGIGKVYSGNVKDWKQHLSAWYNKYHVKCMYNETNPDKGFTADMLEAADVGMSVERYDESMNKMAKISTVLYKYWKDIIWDEDETDEEYMAQVTEWIAGQEPDDAPDSVSSLLREWKEGGSAYAAALYSA
jgi:hypothetical protein